MDGFNNAFKIHENVLCISKSPTEQLKIKRLKVLQWSSQNPDLSMTEMLQWDLKSAVN